MKFFARLAILLAAQLLWSPPVAAEGACDGYPELLSESELREWANRLIRPLPARYAELLGNVQIVNDRDGTSLAPVAVIPLSGGPATITVPRGFKRLSCKLLQDAAGHLAGFYPAGDTPRPAFDECLRTGGTRRICLDRVLADRTQMLDAKGGKDVGYRDALKLWVENAAIFVLAHEAAHVVLSRAVADQSLLGGLDTETAADLLAMLTLPTNGVDMFPAIAQFASWSMVDHTIDWTRQTHASFGCRASTATAIYRELNRSIVLVNAWAAGSETWTKQREAGDYDLNKLAIAGDTSLCGNRLGPQVAWVRGDLDRLLSAIDRVEAMEARDALAMLELLLAVPLATEEVRGMRAQGLTTWALRLAAEDLPEKLANLESMSSEDIEALIGRENLKGEGEEYLSESQSGRIQRRIERRLVADLKRIVFAILDRVEQEADLRLLPADTYGHFVVQSDAIRMTYNNRSDLRRMEARVAHVRRYAPGSALLPFIQGGIAFGRGDCAAGRRYFVEAVRRDPSWKDEVAIFIDPPKGVSCAFLSRMF